MCSAPPFVTISIYSKGTIRSNERLKQGAIRTRMPFGVVLIPGLVVPRPAREQNLYQKLRLETFRRVRSVFT